MCLVIYIIFERRKTSRALAAIPSNARQVRAELLIMFDLKSQRSVWLYIQPHGEPCKGIYLASFQTTATKHALKKMIQNIKQAAIYFGKPVHARQGAASQNRLHPSGKRHAPAGTRWPGLPLRPRPAATATLTRGAHLGRASGTGTLPGGGRSPHPGAAPLGG